MMKETIVEKELKMAECTIKDMKELSVKEGISVTGLIFAGKPYDAIINTAKEKQADLIIVGSHGRTGIDRLLMGSVTERVIGFAECAVLVVKRIKWTIIGLLLFTGLRALFKK